MPALRSAPPLQGALPRADAPRRVVRELPRRSLRPWTLSLGLHVLLATVAWRLGGDTARPASVDATQIAVRASEASEPPDVASEAYQQDELEPPPPPLVPTLEPPLPEPALDGHDVEALEVIAEVRDTIDARAPTFMPGLDLARVSAGRRTPASSASRPAPSASPPAPPTPASARAVAPPIASSHGPSGVVHAPQPWPTNERPRYPGSMLATPTAGTVVLELRIDAEGRVLSVDVVATSGHAALDQEAVRAVRAWRFVPAHQDGRPVATTVRQRVHFRVPV